MTLAFKWVEATTERYRIKLSFGAYYATLSGFRSLANKADMNSYSQKYLGQLPSCLQLSFNGYEIGDGSGIFYASRRQYGQSSSVIVTDRDRDLKWVIASV